MNKSVDHVLERVAELKGHTDLADRNRIRSILNGGAEGVRAVLNPTLHPDDPKNKSLGVDLPTANIMHSGLERLAQQIGRAPTLKTDMIPIADTQTARNKADKRARIVQGWDDMSRMEMQYPQIGRWLPGYGFTFHVIREQRFGDTLYPYAELRDPYDVHLGQWGPDQQPNEAAITRQVSKKRMMEAYPHHAEMLQQMWKRGTGARIPILGTGGQWEGNPNNPVTIVEYYCADGTYVACPEANMMLDWIPNPLDSGPAFVVTKKFSFDKLQSQYHHVVGLMAMMAKLNILGLIATEDATFRETNIIGTMIGDTYERGRKGVNLFEPGTRIEKPPTDQLAQQWQAINILERQIRVVSGYPVSQDGQSPNSFATGEGIRELGVSANENVREYQTAIRHSVELIDRKRLEWDFKMHTNARKKVYWYEGGNHFEETYKPATDIDRDFRTRRVYGAMASFDENSKIIAGLQLLQARIIDRRTMMENLDGLDNVGLILERIDQDMAKEALIQALGERFGMQQDPAAGMALVEIFDNPSDTASTLKKLFTPQEPQMSPEEEQMAAMAAGPGGPMGEGAMGPPPSVQTILSQLEAPGGGAQTVGQIA